MELAILAPPWIPVPPPGYGGIERVVELLSLELVRRGHEVSHPDEIQQAIYEADHVASAFDSIDEAEQPFDVVHDHCGFSALGSLPRADGAALRRRGGDRGALARLRPAQQIALGHQRYGKRPVADRVEEQHDLIAVVALHDSRAPPLVVYK
jgi:glycosyltransferase involved in cell wall biosynthesis